MIDRVISASMKKYWRFAFIASGVVLAAALGTYVSGQYRIGRLDALIGKYQNPVADYAGTLSRTKSESMEAELLTGCKQAQIGSWLQTTDALKFKDPVSGNRIAVILEPGRDFIDINGREISSCVVDEIENRQFDIGSMTNAWAFALLLFSLMLAAAGWFGRRTDPRVFPKF